MKMQQLLTINEENIMMICQNILTSLFVTTCNFRKSFILLVVSVFLISCSETQNLAEETTQESFSELLNLDEQSAEDPNLEEPNLEESESLVRLFPAGFFEPAYSEEYSLTGVDNDGKEYTGTFHIETGNEEVFNGVNAIPVTSTLTYSTVIDGVQVTPLVYALSEYYTASLPRHYLGSVNNSTSQIMTIQGTGIDITEEAGLNTTGILANSIGTDSILEVIEWGVTDNNDSTHTVSFTYDQSDSAGGLISHEVQSFTVNESGNRLSLSFFAEAPSRNITLSFSGLRL